MASGSDFSGKVAVITRASSGIGLATSILFAKKGASVVLCGRNQDRLDTAVDQCKDADSGHSAQFISVNGDVNDPEVRKSLVTKTMERFGKLDILVPNAGVFIPADSIHNCTEETFDTIIDTNIKSVFFLIQEALTHLETSGGNIVCVSSYVSSSVIGAGVVYAMSKASIDHMTRYLAFDLAPKEISVNTVNPSFIQTRILRSFGDHAETLTSQGAERESAKHPLYGECVGAEDIAESIAFLASDRAKFVTAQSHIVDGGRHFSS